MAAISGKVTAFLSALEHSLPDELVSVPGLGTFRSKHVRHGLDIGVLTIHSTGLGFAIVQPKTHGICRECADSKMRSICEHCQCAMCKWFRQADDLASPRVSKEKMQQLARRLRTFTFGVPARTPAIDDDV